MRSGGQVVSMGAGDRSVAGKKARPPAHHPRPPAAPPAPAPALQPTTSAGEGAWPAPNSVPSSLATRCSTNRVRVYCRCSTSQLSTMMLSAQPRVGGAQRGQESRQGVSFLQSLSGQIGESSSDREAVREVDSKSSSDTRQCKEAGALPSQKDAVQAVRRLPALSRPNTMHPARRHSLCTLLLSLLCRHSKP